MKFFFQYFYITSLCLAVQNKNIEIVKMLLENEEIDINHINILYTFFLPNFVFVKYLYYILIQIFKRNLKY